MARIPKGAKSTTSVALILAADHCECGAPHCPTCGEHTDWCDGCGCFHCPSGCWSGFRTSRLEYGATYAADTRRGITWP